MIGPDGKPLAFEIMLKGKEDEQVAIAWQQVAAKARHRRHHPLGRRAQFLQRMINYDFDAMLFQLHVLAVAWGRAGRPVGLRFARCAGTFNFAGVADPAVDAMIEHCINAQHGRISSRRCGPTTGFC